MILKKLKYCRDKSNKNEWIIKGSNDDWVTLNQINLIVGRNASGKSRTIDAIRQISDILVNRKISKSESYYDTATYELEFEDENNKKVEYFLDFKNDKAIQETFTINGIQKLNRKENKLFYEKFNDYSEFNIDDDSLIVSLMEDTVQHPFFKGLRDWGKSLNHYRFGSKLGKNVLLRDVNKDGDEVIAAFIKGKQIDNNFDETLKKDMSKIDYPITTVDVSTLKYLPIGSGLNVQETELSDVIDQTEMSQGMFRALSLLVQLNYSLLAVNPSCILIDDIGEGLDYERSKALIDLIIEKVKNSSVQVIMTTNDRFVMNKVPLEYWHIIKRESGKAIFYNYQNSEKVFDDFEFTGLSNFYFFSSNSYQEL